MTSSSPDPAAGARGADPLPLLPTAAVASAGALLVVAVGLAFVMPPDVHDRVVSNLAQLVAPAAAAGTLLRRARRSRGRLRATWAALGGACACWAAGQAWWAAQEMTGAGIPFPSVADVGFVAFAVLAAVGLLLHPAGGGGRGRWRRTSDAVMCTGAVGLVSWQFVLGPVVARETGTPYLEWLLFLTYPALDVALIVLCLLTAARARRQRPDLLLVCAGLLALSISDGTFAYLQATMMYAGFSADLGWVVGFLLLALAGAAREPAAREPEEGQPERDGGSLVAHLLPYAPVAVGLVTTVVHVALGWELGIVEVGLSTVVIALLLSRQYLALRENLRLSAELAGREALLRHQAFHDVLTGLANRALFLDRLEHALALHRRDLRPVAVVFLDLDDFKVVNDTLGHAAGDELIVRVAERLRGAMRDGDTVARLGGDEFAVLLEDGGDAEEATARALEALRTPCLVGGRPVAVRASVGICGLGPDDPPVRPDTLLARSDTAMYAAKRSGKDKAVVYRPGLSLEEVELEGLAERLRRALAAREVTLAYQPIVDLVTGRVVALEALARWTTEGRAVGPEVFVPAAERAGLLDELTGQLLAQACERAAGWAVDRDDVLSVHVNVAPATLAWPELVPRVRDLVDWHELVPGQLVLELTESGLLAHEEAAERVIRELADLGVGVSLDDFGVGQSSLARLGALSLESVKIDRSFLARIDTDEREATLLGAVFRLARDLALPVIAEGVERPGQLAALRRMGCPQAQGFLLSRPVPAAAVPDLLGSRGVLTG
ncbi:putative bifunctional diguanylate cyclase/phosphodiesterase [Trujillonella endophytica]|uniref:Diguanylate cyclase (GGDEF) domain-containing protein n=1 Tax=Trujillonella endophytica TaxID=673521 RepID=A0A1H8RQL3_9ACTN|nr:EAL domain-containing protein [Trujillella endophytica]SEO68626.1 diguanylate cyclase (GGDEF) domain-containing protein [Trujillella endophytica]